MKTKTNNALASLALVGLSVGATHAYAADGKVYQGSTCKSASFLATPVTRSDNGSITASNGTDVKVGCPIITDNEGNSHAFSVGNIRINESSSTTSFTSCILLSYSSAGLVLDSKSKEATTNGNQNFDLAFDSTNAAINRSYMLSCWLSAGSKLYKYEIEER